MTRPTDSAPMQWTRAELEDWCRGWTRTPHITLVLIYAAAVAMGLAAWVWDFNVWAWACEIVTGDR